MTKREFFEQLKEPLKEFLEKNSLNIVASKSQIVGKIQSLEFRVEIRTLRYDTLVLDNSGITLTAIKYFEFEKIIAHIFKAKYANIIKDEDTIRLKKMPPISRVEISSHSDMLNAARIIQQYMETTGLPFWEKYGSLEKCYDFFQTNLNDTLDISTLAEQHNLWFSNFYYFKMYVYHHLDKAKYHDYCVYLEKLIKNGTDIWIYNEFKEYIEKSIK